MRSVKRLRNLTCLVIGVAAFPAVATITPEITVSLSDQSLVGYVTKGESTPLPSRTGPATIAATVGRHGATAAGSVVVDVR
jgi:hypothetical protein